MMDDLERSESGIMYLGVEPLGGCNGGCGGGVCGGGMCVCGSLDGCVMCMEGVGDVCVCVDHWMDVWCVWRGYS